MASRRRQDQTAVCERRHRLLPTSLRTWQAGGRVQEETGRPPLQVRAGRRGRGLGASLDDVGLGPAGHGRGGHRGDGAHGFVPADTRPSCFGDYLGPGALPNPRVHASILIDRHFTLNSTREGLGERQKKKKGRRKCWKRPGMRRRLIKGTGHQRGMAK